MPPLPSSRQSKADSGSGAADHRNPHSRYYLSEYAEKQIIKKHQKPVLDEYHKDLSALRQRQAGAQPTQAGLTDQNRLEEAAKAKCQAGLKAVQSAITQELKPLEDRIISEYDLFVRKHDIEQEENKLATLLRDNASRGRRRPVRFTREEKAKAEEDWEAERLASGLPIEGDLDDLDPGEVARGQTEDLDPTAEGGPSTITPVEEHFDNDGDGDAMDFESGNEQAEAAEEAEEDEEEGNRRRQRR